MQELISQLQNLDKLSQQLDIPQLQRKQMLSETEGFADKFLGELDATKVFVEGIENPGSLVIDNKKKSLNELLQLYEREVAHTGINAASGKHLGYIPGGGIFTSAIADFIAAVTNPYASVYYASPGAAVIENEVVNWLKRVFSFPETAVGNLASGGSVSTIIAFTAARDKHGVKSDKIKNSVVYLSKQVHHAAQKALRIIGLEDVIIRYIPLDDRHRVNIAELKSIVVADVSGGLNPFLLVGTAGPTDTGAVDPLDELAALAEHYKMWFHVDAAYGGFFILTTKKELFKGIEKAASLIVDPHKGLFIPYGLGAVLIKDREAVLHSYQYAANYMQDAAADELVNSPSNLSPELTKHFRGLRLWLPLQIHGIEPFIACLEEKLLLVKYFRNKLEENGFKVGPEPDLSISYFWYPFKNDADKKNKQLIDEIHKDGDVFFSSSVISGRFVIRIAILSFRTKMKTIDTAMEMILRCLQNIH